MNGSRRVVGRAKHVQRYVRPISDDPTIVGLWRYVEELPLPKLNHPSVVKSCGCGPAQDVTEVLHLASRRAHLGPNVQRPTPPWLISRQPDFGAGDAYYRKAASVEFTNFIQFRGEARPASWTILRFSPSIRARSPVCSRRGFKSVEHDDRGVPPV